MKKSSISMLVIASLLVCFGIGIMIGSMVPYRFIHYYGGFSFRYYGDLPGLYQLSRLLLGGFLFLGGMVFFAAVAVMQAMVSSGRKPVAVKKEPVVEGPKIAVKVAEKDAPGAKEPVSEEAKETPVPPENQ